MLELFVPVHRTDEEYEFTGLGLGLELAASVGRDGAGGKDRRDIVPVSYK